MVDAFYMLIKQAILAKMQGWCLQETPAGRCGVHTCRALDLYLVCIFLGACMILGQVAYVVAQYWLATIPYQPPASQQRPKCVTSNQLSSTNRILPYLLYFRDDGSVLPASVVLNNRCLLRLFIPDCSCSVYVSLHTTSDSALNFVCASCKHVVMLDVCVQLRVRVRHLHSVRACHRRHQQSSSLQQSG